jgi:hypothetical protein
MWETAAYLQLTFCVFSGPWSEPPVVFTEATAGGMAALWPTGAGLDETPA